MAKLSVEASLVASLLGFFGVFGALHVFADIFIESKSLIICAGFLGSIMFVLCLTAICNLEMSLWGRSHQSGWFEVFLALAISVTCMSSLHRVAATTCFVFSIAQTYLLNMVAAGNDVLSPRTTKKQK
eukprot:GCRY01001153.1.p1 GENE.GCRY01001153.1~~GCRY01001153.1.p1  ORF type:complete len:128 (+),score=9.98 GCRY01001153.1:176-559(+)